MKGKKEARKTKAGRPLKDVVPASFGKPPREPLPIVYPDNFNAKRSYDFSPPELCNVWPGDEVARSQDFGVEHPQSFEDQGTIFFPKSVYDFADGPVMWRWAEDVVGMNEIHSRFSRRMTTSATIIESQPHRPRPSVQLLPNRLTLIGDSLTAGDYAHHVEKAMAVVTFYERDETDEEFEERKAHELEKQAAAKKKGKVEEIHIGKVKEVKLGNIEMGKPLPFISKWMSSQLQILKDMDFKNPATGEPIWKLIYPQVDGIPVYNPGGKYWVKLMLYGKERLVEIDGKMPVTVSGILLLPRSSTIRDLWPMLLSKAYFKLYSFHWKNFNPYITKLDDEINGSFIYSLTGFLPQFLQINQITEQSWDLIQRHLQDEYWLEKRSIVSVHCSNEKDPYIPSMQQDSRPEETPSRFRSRNDYIAVFEENKLKSGDSQAFNESGRKKKLRSHGQMLRDAASQALNLLKGRSTEFSEKMRPCYVMKGFGYLLFETFANSPDLDIKKVIRTEKARAEEEAKTNLLRCRATSPARRLQKHQSPARLREYQKRKVRRDKEKEERRQKVAEIKENPIYRFLRIKTAVTNTPVLNISCRLTVNELEEAKLRMLNKEFFTQRELEILERQMEEEDRELFDPPNDNDDEKRSIVYPPIPGDLNQPLLRLNGGVWVQADDFPSAFQQVIVYESIKFFSHQLVLEDLWHDTQHSYTPNENFEVWVVDVPEGFNEQIELLVGYSPLIPDQITFNPKGMNLIITSYDFENESIEEGQAYTILQTNTVLATYLTLAPGQNYTLRAIQNCLIGGSIIWINSNIPITTMSRVQYLQEYRGWNHQHLQQDYPPLQQKGFFVISKIDLVPEGEDEFMLRVKFSDGYLRDYCEAFLLDRDQEDPHELARLETLDLQELQMRRFRLRKNEKGYRLVLFAIPPISISEGSIQFECLQREGQMSLTPIELIDPIEVQDRYLPNKYGLIFKEFLFVADETVVSLQARLKKGGMVVPGGKGKEAAQSEEHPIQEQLVTILELYQGNTLIHSTIGYNQCYIPHINLQNTSEELLLIYRFDLRYTHSITTTSPKTEDLNWALRIISSDTVGVCKDTRKEDHEEAIRKTWETQQPGRAELAKSTRAVFIAENKARQGLPLTEAEEALVKDPWEVRRKHKKEHAETAAVKGKPKGKEDRKGVVKEEVQVIQERPISRAEDHHMVEIKEYLNHIKQPRLKHFFKEEQNLLDDDQMNQIKARNQEQIEEFLNIHHGVQAERNEYKAFMIAKRDEFKQQVLEQKERFEAVRNAYTAQREGYKHRVEQRKELQLKIQTALQMNDIATIESCYNEAAEFQIDPGMLLNAKKVLKKHRLQKYTEVLGKCVQDKNIEEVKNNLEAIKRFKIEFDIDHRLVERARRLVRKAEEAHEQDSL